MWDNPLLGVGGVTLYIVECLAASPAFTLKANSTHPSCDNQVCRCYHMSPGRQACPQLGTTGLNVYCELINSNLTASLEGGIIIKSIFTDEKVRLREVRKLTESYIARD